MPADFSGGVVCPPLTKILLRCLTRADKRWWKGMRLEALGIEIAHREPEKDHDGNGLAALAKEIPTRQQTGVRENGMDAFHDLIGLLLVDGVLDFSALEMDG
jgi:hypothetical protein